MKKRIAYITGSRAEYGIVKRLLRRFQNDSELDFVLVTTAMHLDPQYGQTEKIIEADGFPAYARIPLHLDSSNNATIIRSMAECLEKFGDFFQNEYFDAVMLLGDRYEMLAVGIAAAMHNIPLIHLHGGEQTLGNYDEFIRHSLTKMSRLHLTATEDYRRRVIQLGEPPESVHNIGSMGAENSLLLDLPSKAELAAQFGNLDKPYFMVVFHPETLTSQPLSEQLDELCAALQHYASDYDLFFIGSNSDTSSHQIFERLQSFSAEKSSRFFACVQPEQYLGLIQYSAGLIGNTSSGLLEVPSLGVGMVNIGDRQKGRMHGNTVIDAPIERAAIIAAIEKLRSPEFQEQVKHKDNPYFQEHCMERAFALTKQFLQQTNNREPKVFYDLPA